jgi:hypothetical protein
MTAPVRLRRSRAKGSRLVSPNGLPVVCVSRPSKWGNPFVLARGPAQARTREAKLRSESVAKFRRAISSAALPFTIEDVCRELRGKNLACWCPLDGPCHADVLLEVANRKAAMP